MNDLNFLYASKFTLYYLRDSLWLFPLSNHFSLTDVANIETVYDINTVFVINKC